MQARMVGSGCGGKLSTWRDWEVDGWSFILSTGAYRLPSQPLVILPRRCGWGTAEWLKGRHPQRWPGVVVGLMAGNTVTIQPSASLFSVWLVSGQGSGCLFLWATLGKHALSCRTRSQPPLYHHLRFLDCRHLITDLVLPFDLIRSHC